MDKVFDCILIGSSVASISCAIYLKRFNRDVLVLGKDEGALKGEHYIDNYYGVPHITGHDLHVRGIKQATDLGISVLDEEVLNIELGENFLVETTKDGQLFRYFAKKIFLGVGKGRSKSKIPNLNAYLGNGVSFCAICDGFFYRKKRIGIIGDGPFMEHELNILKRFSDQIYVFTNNKNFVDEAVTIIKEEVTSLYGDNKLEGVKTLNQDIKLDGLFLANGSQNSITFAKHLGLILDEKDNIVVDNYETNIKGIFAGGDCIGGLLQVVKAAYDGAQSAIVINNSLKK